MQSIPGSPHWIQLSVRTLVYHVHMILGSVPISEQYKGMWACLA